MRGGLDSDPSVQVSGSAKANWTLSPSGRFSSKSMWLLLNSNQPAVAGGNWEIVWKFKGPSNPSVTLWLAKRMRLLIMDILMQRQIVAQGILLFVWYGVRVQFTCVEGLCTS